MKLPENLLEQIPESGARLLALSSLDTASAAVRRLEDPHDTEALHDFRVAVRGLRSRLKAYRRYFKQNISRKLLTKVKELASSTNATRDAEVQLQWLNAQKKALEGKHALGLQRLIDRLSSFKSAGYDEIRAQVQERFGKLEPKLRERLMMYRLEIHLERPRADCTFAAATAELIREDAQELEDYLRFIEGPEDEENSHEARLVVKRLRCLLDPIRHFIPECKPMVKRLKGLQDTLGELHDSHVMSTEVGATIEVAATQQARELLASVMGGYDSDRSRHDQECRDIVAIANVVRGRTLDLYQKLEKSWLRGRAEGFLGQVHDLANRLSAYEAITPHARLSRVARLLWSPRPATPEEGGKGSSRVA
ncbi:CHAD domain protein [Planctomycetes bacterium Pan216]|uniref:CHAD domain protein n=1 Tax=Kolteria novifilia TaxID=2527975 RepID=A0A518AYT6_9BACT|nr:CHAD domain protein [Planctomycetes bacterium Pan216]